MSTEKITFLLATALMLAVAAGWSGSGILSRLQRKGANLVISNENALRMLRQAVLNRCR